LPFFNRTTSNVCIRGRDQFCGSGMGGRIGRAGGRIQAASQNGVADFIVSRILSGVRQPGSVRFAPYYKAQWYDDTWLAWRDVQRQYATADEARAAFLAGRRCRVMEIRMTGRAPLPDPPAS
jgi:hypothetical protein